MNDEKKNHRIVVLLLLVVAGMVGIAYGSVPFYRLFCSATGYGGTTQRVEAAAVQKSDRMVTVSFDANVDPSLPWDFKPNVRSVQVKLGETKTVTFHAHNRSDKTVNGMATFNVQPDKAGSYFNKIQCFCFDKQTLAAGQSEDMAVQFYVDPAIATDKDTNDVTDITLSYTFFLSKEQPVSNENVHLSQPTPTPRAKTGNPT